MLTPADRPQEPEWRDEVVRAAGIDFNPHFALEYHTNAYLHAVVEGAALRLRATCQERDTLRLALEQYGTHKWPCTAGAPFNPGPCSCGLNDYKETTT